MGHKHQLNNRKSASLGLETTVNRSNGLLISNHQTLGSVGFFYLLLLFILCGIFVSLYLLSRLVTGVLDILTAGPHQNQSVKHNLFPHADHQSPPTTSTPQAEWEHISGREAPFIRSRVDLFLPPPFLTPYAWDSMCLRWEDKDAGRAQLLIPL